MWALGVKNPLEVATPFIGWLRKTADCQLFVFLLAGLNVSELLNNLLTSNINEMFSCTLDLFFFCP